MATGLLVILLKNKRIQEFHLSSHCLCFAAHNFTVVSHSGASYHFVCNCFDKKCHLDKPIENWLLKHRTEIHIKLQREHIINIHHKSLSNFSSDKFNEKISRDCGDQNRNMTTNE